MRFSLWVGRSVTGILGVTEWRRHLYVLKTDRAKSNGWMKFQSGLCYCDSNESEFAMNEIESTNDSDQSNEPKWQRLDSMQRRVLGVLVEKAKTTPDAYPLTVNSIKTASNQKSNRSPQMDLAADDVMATLDELRDMGAVSEIQGDGRTDKYRHRAYEWLGVDKFELAVMTELLLRGEQTLGELRGRAARMEPIAGMSELKPILASLKQKGLLAEVTPAGRGQIVTHSLYLQHEQPAATTASTDSADATTHLTTTPAPPTPAPAKSTVTESGSPSLEQRVATLEKRLALLESKVESL